VKRAHAQWGQGMHVFKDVIFLQQVKCCGNGPRDYGAHFLRQPLPLRPADSEGASEMGRRRERPRAPLLAPAIEGLLPGSSIGSLSSSSASASSSSMLSPLWALLLCLKKDVLQKHT
jgi:hypothetical protein